MQNKPMIHFGYISLEIRQVILYGCLIKAIHDVTFHNGEFLEVVQGRQKELSRSLSNQFMEENLRAKSIHGGQEKKRKNVKSTSV